MANGTVKIEIKDCDPINMTNTKAAFGVIITEDGIRAYQMGTTNALEQVAAVARLRQMADEMMKRTPFKDDPEFIEFMLSALKNSEVEDEEDEEPEVPMSEEFDNLLKSIFGADAEEKEA